jgi:hypothetical protein
MCEHANSENAFLDVNAEILRTSHTDDLRAKTTPRLFIYGTRSKSALSEHRLTVHVSSSHGGYYESANSAIVS